MNPIDESAAYEKWLQVNFYGRDPVLWWVKPEQMPAIRTCNGQKARWLYLDNTTDDIHVASHVFHGNKRFQMPMKVHSRHTRSVMAWPDDVDRLAIPQVDLEGFVEILKKNGLSGECRKCGTDERRKF